MILSVSEQEGHAEVADFIGRYGLDYPFALDETGEIGRNYNLYTTPTTYFITPDGVVQDIVPGVVSEFWIDNQMARLES